MFKTLSDWNSYFEKTVNTERILEDIKNFYSYSRWSSTAKLQTLAKKLTSQLKKEGFSDVDIIQVPADGKTRYGGWVSSLAWSPRSASLDILLPDGKKWKIADYKQNPHQLVMFSGATPPNGISAEIIIVSENPDKNEIKKAKGRICLLTGLKTWEFTEKLMNAGAVGFITDAVKHLSETRDDEYIKDAVQYNNYMLQPWDVPDKQRGFAFAISPAQGKRLRSLLAENNNITALANVDVELGNNTQPVITAAIPGKSRQEIIISGHIDEPGANDNASGPALALELGRSFIELKKKHGDAVLKRGVRFFFSNEVRGLQSLLNIKPKLFRKGVLGINLDMVGCDPDEVNSRMKIISNQAPLPDFGLPLMLEAFKPLGKITKRYKPDVSSFGVNDNMLAIPTMILEMAPEKNYHTSLDTPDKCSKTALQRHAGAIGSWLGSITTADTADLENILEINYKYSRQQLKIYSEKPRQRFFHQLSKEKLRIMGILKLVTDSDKFPFVTSEMTLEKWNAERPDLTPLEHIKKIADDYCRKLQTYAEKLAKDMTKKLVTEKSSPVLKEQARKIIPKKTFKGFFTLDGIPCTEAKILYLATGLDKGRWQAPPWLHLALDLSNGKRNLLEIQNILLVEKYKKSLDLLVNTFNALEKTGYVTMRPYVDEKSIKKALNNVGVKRGMTLMVHSSLSQFGYIENGPIGLIDSLLSALGVKGTLCMPTHSLSLLGGPVYNKKTSPSLVGAVTNAFIKFPDVIRSNHPSHSVACHGLLANQLVKGHDHRCAPLAKEGFWGNFVNADGWVLMMSPLGSNTLMHSAELWQGLNMPGAATKTNKNTTVEIPSMPWHTDWFDDVYKLLRKREQIHSTPLGASQIHLMRGADILEAATEIITKNPLLPASCGKCIWCRYVKGELQ